MNESLVEKIVATYGLKSAKVLKPQKGYRNYSCPAVLEDGRTINVILYKDEVHIVKRIKNANKVSDYLASLGLPARRTLDDRILAIETLRGKRYVALYTYLPGSTISWEAYTKEHIKSLGGAMASMHKCLEGMSTANIPSVEEEYVNILEKMYDYFSDSNVAAAMTSKLRISLNLEQLNFYKSLLAGCTRLKERQVLHMDFVRSNILFEETKITGILDFEKTAVGHRLFDLSRTLAFLTVDCKYKPKDKVRKYFLYSGYTKRGGEVLSRKQLMLIDKLVEMFWLNDLYKFLRHNPYENLADNEHFVRTKDELISSGLLTSLR